MREQRTTSPGALGALKHVQLNRLQQWQRTTRGLLVVALVALVASALPSVLARAPEILARLPISPILVAIVLGLLLAATAQRRPAWAPGLSLAAGPWLKFAVMLIGLRLSLVDVGVLGLQAVPLVLGALLSGLGLAWLLGRLLGLERNTTALLAVGSAICGASAIAATAPALKPRPEQTAYALACVALFGLAATLLYPWLLGSRLFEGWLGDPRAVGLVLGAAVHDTAQVTAAALMHEQAYGQTGTVAAATVTKLLRNLSMLVVIPAVIWWALRGQQSAAARPGFPLFILGFLLLAGVRSAGDLLFAEAAAWQALLSIAAMASAFLFAMAMAAIGMGIRLGALATLGARPAVLALLTALGMGAVAIGLTGLITGSFG